MFFSGLVVGPLVDKGYFRICFHGGSILLSASLILTSFCRDWLQLFLIQGVWTGIAMGMVFSACVINITTYFSTHLGLVSGLAAAGASVGAIHPRGYSLSKFANGRRRNRLSACGQGVD